MKEINESPLNIEQSPVAFLRQIFLERKNKNSSYSTRAFARDLGISQTLLSLVLNHKRPLSVKQAAQISILLGLSTDDSKKLLESTVLAAPKNSKTVKKLREQRQLRQQGFFTDYSIERFKTISQWHHIAILDLSTTSDFKSNSQWIASRLGISRLEAQDAIERLVKLGLLEQKHNKLQKCQSKLFFSTERSEPAVRSFHQQMLSKAQDILNENSDEDFKLREISSVTMAIRKDRMAEAKVKIKKFQSELTEFLTADECDEVFQFNIQLFPLTKITKPEKK